MLKTHPIESIGSSVDEHSAHANTAALDFRLFWTTHVVKASVSRLVEFVFFFGIQQFRHAVSRSLSGLAAACETHGCF